MPVRPSESLLLHVEHLASCETSAVVIILVLCKALNMQPMSTLCSVLLPRLSTQLVQVFCSKSLAGDPVFSNILGQLAIFWFWLSKPACGSVCHFHVIHCCFINTDLIGTGPVGANIVLYP